MYVINNMDFYVKIVDIGDSAEVQLVTYVEKDDATRYETISEAASEAEALKIYGFSVEKY